jgi:hypothetical protein
MSQLPLSQNVKLDVTLSKIFDSTPPSTPDAGTYGYMYKKAADAGLFWKTLTSGEINLSSPTIASTGTATQVSGGDIDIIAPSNTSIGTYSLHTAGSSTTYLGAITAIGAQTLAALSDSIHSWGTVVVGYGAGTALTTTYDNVIIGFNAMAASPHSYRDIIIGSQALSQSTTPPGFDIAIGFQTLNSATYSGGYNIAMGDQALNAATTADYNTAIGFNSGILLTTGEDNTFLGANTGNTALTCSSCIAIGPGAMASNAASDGIVSIGVSSLYQATGTGTTAVGYSSGFTLTTGVNNTFLGYNADVGTNTHANCILIGKDAKSTASAQIRLGFSSAASSVQTSCFIDGIRARTTTQNDAIAVLVDSKGQLGTVSSSKRYKHDINPLLDDVIESVFQMNPVSFIYNDDKSNTITYGMIAEQMANIRPDIVVYQRDPTTNDYLLDSLGNKIPETIQYHLVVPLLVGAVRKLREENTTLRNQLLLYGQAINQISTSMNLPIYV